MAESAQYGWNKCNEVSSNLLIKPECSSYFREEVEIFFSTMDRDFDGRLSFSEIMGEETAIETLFKQMDKDGDGFVSKKVKFFSLCIEGIRNNKVVFEDFVFSD